MSAAGPQQRLRRALIGGYRVADVEVALAGLRLALSRLQLEVESATAARGQAEQTVERMRREVGAAEERAAALAARLAALQQEHDELARSARRSVTAAQEEVLRAREQSDEAVAARKRLGAELARLARELDRDGSTTEAADEAAAGPAPRADDDETVAANTDGAAAFVGPRLELDAGPFDQIASVLEFERALRGVPNVTDVYVRHLAAGRARVELDVFPATRLAEDLVSHLPFPVDLTPRDSTHATLTIHPPAASA